MAAAREIATVTIITLIPWGMDFKTGATENTRLNIAEIMMTPATTLFSFAGGIIIAKNIPYSPTPRALTSLKGRIFPIITPKKVPKAHPGIDTLIAP